MKAAPQNLGCIRSDWENVNGERKGMRCGAAEVRCSALCLAPIEAPRLAHSALSCRVMDLFPAACGTSCSQTAWAASHNTKQTETNVHSITANHWKHFQLRAACDADIKNLRISHSPTSILSKVETRVRLRTLRFSVPNDKTKAAAQCGARVTESPGVCCVA